MNNLLIELAKRCGDWSGETIEMNDVGLQKFTEYIIQDIINVIDNHVEKIDPDDLIKEIRYRYDQ